MRELFQKVTMQINRLWERTEKRDRIRFLIIAGIAIVAIVVAIYLLTRTQYAILYHDMDPDEAGQVLETLTGMGVDARPQGTGTIMVPETDLERVSMELAAQGVPKSGFTYDVFQMGSGYGTTDYEKKKYDIFQLQDRLQNAINLNPDIRRAIVTLSIPDNTKSIFQSEMYNPSASVMLVMESGAKLTTENIVAIENLVASAVANLDRKDISITDDSLSLLNGKEGLDVSSMQDNLQFRREVSDELARRIRMLLIPVFGIDHVQVGVDAVLNFDEHSAEKITFSPVNEEEMTGIDVSFKKMTEKASGIEGALGEPGIDENGAAGIYPQVNTNNNVNYSNVTEEVNREVNELQEKITYEKGRLTHLTVSVIIDSDKIDNTDPANPDPAGEPANIRSIVGGSVGLEPDMWENLIQVSYLKFSGQDDDQLLYQNYQNEQGRGLLYELIRSIALYAIIALCIIVVFLTLARMFRKKPTEEELEAMRALDALERGELTPEELEMQGLLDLATGEDETGIEEKRSPIREKIEDFIDRNPESVANLLRNWLADEDTGKW